MTFHSDEIPWDIAAQSMSKNRYHPEMSFWIVRRRMTCGLAVFGSGRQLEITMAKHKSQIGVPAGDTEIKKELPMRLQDWEATIQEIVDECNHDQTRPDRVLMEWRGKLEKGPALLKPFQIDELVRAVRHRLSTATG